MNTNQISKVTTIKVEIQHNNHEHSTQQGRITEFVSNVYLGTVESSYDFYTIEQLTNLWLLEHGYSVLGSESLPDGILFITKG